MKLASCLAPACSTATGHAKGPLEAGLLFIHRKEIVSLDTLPQEEKYVQVNPAYARISPDDFLVLNVPLIAGEAVTRNPALANPGERSMPFVRPPMREELSEPLCQCELCQSAPPEERICQLLDANRELLAANEKLFDENETLARKVGQFRGSNERLVRENERFHKEYEKNKELNEEYEDHLKLSERLTEENERLHRENAQLCTRDGANTSIVSGLQKRYATLEKENKRFKEAYRVLYESWMRSQEENRKLQNELDIARQTILHLDGWLRNEGKWVETRRTVVDMTAVWRTKALNEKDEKIKKLEKALTENEKIDAIKLQQQRDVLYGNFFRNNFGNWQAKSLANSSLTIQGALTKIEAEKVRSM